MENLVGQAGGTVSAPDMGILSSLQGIYCYFVEHYSTGFMTDSVHPVRHERNRP